MYRVIKTQRRSNTQIEFGTMTSSFIIPEVKLYFAEVFKRSGKCLDVTISITEDETLYTSTMLWDSESSYNEFISDTFLIERFFDPLVNHMTENNIIFNVQSKETI